MTAFEVMLDTIGADSLNIPVTIPKVAGYVTGTDGIEWSATDWARFPKSGHVRIDQSDTLDAWVVGADVADVENGAASISTAVTKAKLRQAKGWYSWVYIAQSGLESLEKAMVAGGVTKVQYWVANWNLNEAEAVALLGDKIVAVQYASPSSNPTTITPDGKEPLSSSNVDISVTIPSWFAYVPPTPAVIHGIVVTSGLATHPVSSTNGVNWVANG